MKDSDLPFEIEFDRALKTYEENMTTYLIFTAPVSGNLETSADTNESLACEIFAAMSGLALGDRNYVSVALASAPQSIELDPSQAVATLSIHTSGLVLWKQRYRASYICAHQLHLAAMDHDCEGIITHAEQLSALLEQAPELGEYDLTDRLGIDRCGDNFENEANAVFQIAEELEAILGCTIAAVPQDEGGEFDAICPDCGEPMHDHGDEAAWHVVTAQVADGHPCNGYFISHSMEEVDRFAAAVRPKLVYTSAYTTLREAQAFADQHLQAYDEIDPNAMHLSDNLH